VRKNHDRGFGTQLLIALWRLVTAGEVPPAV
jgi:hypothetical protein